jgi:hypothetical protein
MDFLFHFQLLIGVIALSRNWFGRINYCPAALGGRDNKKSDFRHFLNSSKLSAKSAQVISPYTSNASDRYTVLHTLCIIQDDPQNP